MASVPFISRKALQSSSKLPYFFVWVDLKTYLIVKEPPEDCHQVEQSYIIVLGLTLYKKQFHWSWKLNLLYEDDSHTFSLSGRLVLPDRASSCAVPNYKKRSTKSFLLLFSFSLLVSYVNPVSEQRRSITANTLLRLLSLARTIITRTLDSLITYVFSSSVWNLSLWLVSVWVIP